MKKITLPLILLLFCYNTSIGQTTATYNVVFTNHWNSTDHSQGTSFPGSNAHWSNIVGVNHNNLVTFFEMGAPATTGVKNIAELGNEGVFKNTEVPDAIGLNTAEQFFELGDLFLNASNTATLNGLQVNENHPLISLLSMIAPSPDWFAGVNSLNLRDGSGWINTVSVDLFPYDAGTEEGTAYSLTNADTDPIDTIQNIQGIAPFNTEKVATLTFTLQSVLSTNETNNSVKNIQVYPNPAKDKLTLSNLKNTDLKSVEIYSVLGSLSTSISVKNSITNLDIDLSNLNSGIYLLKLNSKQNSTTTRKLIVK